MKIILSFILSCLSAVSMAQVHGFVKEKENNISLEYANITLVAPDDSTIIAYTVADSTGYFKLSTSQTEGKVKVTYLGYKSQEIVVNNNTDLGTIYLQKDKNMLGEVTVKANRVVRTAKGLTVNVNNTVLGKLGDAKDVLKHIPFVMVKNDDVSVIGKGEPVIYINNRKLLDNDELKQIQSSDIKKIDVITNPGTEYDATVNAVIKIYTSRPVGEGLGGFINEGIRSERNISHNGTASLNYRKGGLDLFGSLNYSRYNYEYNQRTTTRFSTLEIEDTSVISGNTTPLNSSLGFNYQKDDKLSFGMEYKNLYSPKNPGNVSSELTARHNSIRRFSEKTNDERRQSNKRHYINGYFNYSFSEETSIQLNVDYLNLRKKESQDYFADEDAMYTNTVSNNKLYAGKLKFATLMAGGTLNTGLEGSYSNNDNDYKILENTTIDNELSNSKNTAKTGLFSAFVEYERALGKNWNVSAGGRFEHEDFKYTKSEEDETNTIHNAFFPSASIAYESGDINLSLSYRYTTIRPGYYSLRSSTVMWNPYSYGGGTPDLKNTQKNKLSFSMGWKDLQLNVDYGIFTNYIIHVRDMYHGSDSITIFHPTNIKDYQYLNVTAVYSPTLFKVWKPVFTVDILKQFVTYNGQNYNKPYVDLMLENTVDLPHSFILGADIELSFRGNDGIQVEYSKFNFDAYCIKTFFKDKLHVKLAVENLFNTYYDGWYMNTNGIYFDKWTDYTRRIFSLSVKYTFNPAKKKYKGEAASSELNRF